MGWLMNQEGTALLVPPTVEARLKAIDDRLGMVWHPMLKTFCLTLRWAQDDPRWAYVQRGEWPEGAAYQTIGYLPQDCSADEAAAVAEREVIRAGAKLPDVQAVLDATARRNAAVAAAKGQQLVEESFVQTDGGVGKRRKRVDLPKE